jgi:hypothetical protein
MTERTFIPNSPACGQWETLLAEALDGLLKPKDEAVFNTHRAVCPACAALYEEARRGREWLEFLSPEPEMPAGLLDRILAHTGPGQTADYQLATSGGNVLPMIPAWQRPGLMGGLRRFAEPRLMMTAAMAFFSITMTLSLTGIRLSDLRPSAVRSLPSVARSFMERRLTMASTPIIRYYDHLRLVYEVQTRMRELRRTTEGEGVNHTRKQQDATPGESKSVPEHKDGGSRMGPPQQSGSPVFGPGAGPAGEPAAEPAGNDSDFTEASLIFQHRSAHSGGSRKEVRERSTIWTA